MKFSRRLLSAALSGIFICSSALSQAVSADDNSTDIYDTIISEESKEKSEETNITEDEQTSETTTETTTTTTTAVETVKAVASAAVEVPFNVFDIFTAHQGYVENLLSSVNKYRRAEGIDVSEWQKEVDWQKIKNAGVEFAIVRAGYGKYRSQIDPYFDTNIRQAQALGIDTGAYWYSYATTVEAAKAEAELCYEVIKNYDYTYPIYFDIEDACQLKLTTEEVSKITETFCSYLTEKGYKVGIYSYTNFLNTKIYKNVLDKYDVWVAHFSVEVPNYNLTEYGIWQYEEKGRIDGIQGDVDLNHAYINYPSIVSPETYDPTRYPGITTEPQYPEITLDPGIANGIDISEWQKTIDWKAVSEDEIDYAIIRAGYGRFLNQKDKNFDINMREAEKYGLGRGVYWYSYATTVENAILEAETCLEVIKDYKLDYPVYFDVEDPIINRLSKKEVTAITDAFCSVIEDAGYYVGITSYPVFLYNKIDESLFRKYSVWVAHYGVKRPSFRYGYGMWQYTSTGTVNGIDGDVDRDFLYVDFPSLIKEYHLNGY